MKTSTRIFLSLGLLLTMRFVLHNISSSPLDHYSFSKLILARRGELLKLILSGDEKYRLRVPLSSINKNYIEAVLLKEDQYFYYHPGVNPLSMWRAFQSTFSDRRLGGSTITMQLVRLREGLRTRTVSGKAHQMLRALWYECLYDKDTILEAYLNLLPFGANIEGIEAASRIFFHKSNQKLALNEWLLLALVPQSPQLRKLDHGNVEKLSANFSNLLSKWSDNHPSDRPLLSMATLPPFVFGIKDLPFNAPHFSQWALRQSINTTLIQTSLDLHLQRAVESKISKFIRGHQNRGISNAAALIVNYQTNEILSWVGSNNFFEESIDGQVDGVLAARSPGSTLKPFIYAAALEEGLIHPMTLLKDSPVNLGSYDPENFDRQFMGPLSATKALTESRNIPAVSLALQLRKQNLFQLLKKAGVPLARSEEYYGMAINLGGAEMSLFDLTRLYAGLARLGVVEEFKGSTSRENRRTRILSEEASYLVLSMLTENLGMGHGRIEKWGRQAPRVAWKTGTSWGYRDAWTLGVVGPYVIGVWLGNFDNSSNNFLVGRTMASPLFFDLMSSLPNKDLESPPLWDQYRRLNLTRGEVCPLSGGIRGENCPHSLKTFFIPGVSPIHKCQIHRKILVSKESGYRLCSPSVAPFETRVVEFWPSDLLKLFARAGLPKRPIPAMEKKCFLGAGQGQGLDPEILSPKKNLVYTLNLRNLNQNEQIPFQANADGDVKKLFWFANHRFVGESQPQETLFKALERGRYEILVVDDQGRTASANLHVEIN